MNQTTYTVNPDGSVTKTVTTNFTAAEWKIIAARIIDQSVKAQREATKVQDTLVVSQAAEIDVNQITL